jgi:hypothetical protein
VRANPPAICPTADTAAREPRNGSPKTDATVQKAIKPQSRCSRTRRSDVRQRDLHNRRQPQKLLASPRKSFFDKANMGDD